MIEIPMPRLSDSMEEGTILRWLLSEGAAVERGTELAEIETDKASMVYEADDAGTLHILAAEGDTLPIGAPMAQLLAEGEEPSAPGASASEGATGGDESGATADGGTGEAGTASEPQSARAGANAGGAQPAAAEANGGGAAAGGGKQATAGGQGQASSPPAPETPRGRVKASPLARRLASEAGLELASISGSGPGGRIVKADVERATELAGRGPSSPPAAGPQAGGTPPTPLPSTGASPTGAVSPAGAGPGPVAGLPGPPSSQGPGGAPSAKGKGEVVKLSRTQELIARRMAEAKATIPEFTLQCDIDMDAAVALRAQLKRLAEQREQAPPSFNDLIVKACGLALRQHPTANGSYKDGNFELHGNVNVGVAVATADALVVPVVRDADTRSVWEITAETRRLAAAVRDGTVVPPELSGGTFSVSNLGMYGIDSFTAVINPPQAAILAVGSLAPRPVVRDGQLVVGSTMTVTLSCDHRILYGADAAQFLGAIRELLEQPLSLLA